MHNDAEMSKIETKIIDFIQKHILILGFAAVAVIAFMLRVAFFDIMSGDWQFFLYRWIEELDKYGGLKGIGHEIGEYNVPYMLFLNIVAKTPFNDLYEVKAFSVLFDYICALAVVRIAFDKKELISPRSLIVYTIVLISPVSFLDSAYWAQCDVIYTAVALISLYCLIKERYLGAMIAFGFAIALKLQAIFFLPVLLIYYFATKKMSIRYVLAVPAVYLVSILPAIIAGRGFMDTLKIYAKQTKLYTALTMNCPNIYYILNGNAEMFRKMGMLLAIVILGIAACYFIYHKIESPEAYILLAFWCSTVCIYFLPGMHERYSYMACIFGIVYAVVNRKGFWIALGINLVTLLSWLPYLFSITPIKFEYLSIINFILLIILSVKLFTVKNELPETVLQ